APVVVVHCRGPELAGGGQPILGRRSADARVRCLVGRVGRDRPGAGGVLAVTTRPVGRVSVQSALRRDAPGGTTIALMTDSPAAAPPAPAATDDRPYSPGLEGVIAGETSLSKVDGANGRLTYRGYRIGDLVEHGT